MSYLFDDRIHVLDALRRIVNTMSNKIGRVLPPHCSAMASDYRFPGPATGGPNSGGVRLTSRRNTIVDRQSSSWISKRRAARELPWTVKSRFAVDLLRCRIAD